MNRNTQMQTDDIKPKKTACYTVPELADTLGLSTETVYRGIRRGEIPHLRIGQRRLILPRASIDRWLASAGDTANARA